MFQEVHQYFMYFRLDNKNPGRICNSSPEL